MPDLTPIPTEYEGHLFRSRLEARWAVFFDALEIRWRYEEEGYDLDGSWYLPDFWLPDFKMWIEIKPETDKGDNDKCRRLARASRRKVLLIAGNPWLDAYGITVYTGNMESEGETFRFASGRRNERELWLMIPDYMWLCLNPQDEDDTLPHDASPKMMDAYRAARSARFEHGHSGRTL